MKWNETAVKTIVRLYYAADVQPALQTYRIYLFIYFYRLGWSRLPPCSVFENPSDGRCGSGWSRGELALYNAGTRVAWGVALMLLCFVCFSGQVGENGVWLTGFEGGGVKGLFHSRLPEVVATSALREVIQHHTSNVAGRLSRDSRCHLNTRGEGRGKICLQ